MAGVEKDKELAEKKKAQRLKEYLREEMPRVLRKLKEDGRKLPSKIKAKIAETARSIKG